MGGLFCGLQDFGDVLVASRLTELVYDLVLLDLGQIDGECIRPRKKKLDIVVIPCAMLQPIYAFVYPLAQKSSSTNCRWLD